MNSALRSSVIETLMLLLFMAWMVVFSASLLHPDTGSLERRVEGQSQVLTEIRHS